MRRPPRRFLNPQKPRRERRLRAEPGQQFRQLAGRALVVAERLERRGELGARTGVIRIEGERFALRERGEAHLPRL